MRMYEVDFKMKGTVSVPAHDAEEARSRAMSDAILPGLSHYDVQTAEVTEVTPRRGESA